MLCLRSQTVRIKMNTGATLNYHKALALEGSIGTNSSVESKITWKHIPAGQARITYSCVVRRTIVKYNISR